MLKKLRIAVFAVPVTILISGVLASLIDLPAFLQTTSDINDWILLYFSDVLNWASFGFVITCIWVWFSPLSRVTIGGEGAVPLLSRWQWFSITLCTTIAIGILFWASAEPLFHYYQPPADSGIDAASPEAARFAISSLFMHWSITPYAIYTVPALTFALAYYNLGKSFSLSGPLSVFWKPLSAKWARDAIDALALFALVAGMAASLGAGILSISGGIDLFAPGSSGGLITGAVSLAIIATFTISSATGLMRGIRLFSGFNVRFFFLLCAALLMFGPTVEILKAGATGIADYAAEFLPRSIGVGATGDDTWQRAWTSYYWANWLAWAPITSLFLGRIARGYTVRQFMVVNLILPSAFAVLWMSIFGASTLEADAASGSLYQALETTGPESVIYKLFETLPYAGVWTVSFIVLSFVCYVTAADSNTEAIASVCLKGTKASKVESKTARKANMYLKIIWASLIGTTAWIMVTYSGIDGVRMLSNLGGLPGLIIVVLMNVSLVFIGTRKLKRVSRHQ